MTSLKKHSCKLSSDQYIILIWVSIIILMRRIFYIIVLFTLLLSCKQSYKEKELSVKEKELELKERELEIRENVLDNQNSSKTQIDYLSEWLEKLIGSDIKFDLAKANLNSSNYQNSASNDLTDEIRDINGELNLTQLTNAQITTTYSDKLIVLKIKTEWNHIFFALEDKFIWSVHHGSSGESVVYNLITKQAQLLDFEIESIANGVASIHESWHDDNGYVSRNGKYNLQNEKITWGPDKHF